MTRYEILAKLQNYFQAYELVDKQTYDRFGDESFQFFDTDTLHCLLVLREGIGEPFTINTWKQGGSFDERGLRTNLSDIVKGKTNKNSLYLSGHVLGKAFDFTAKTTSPDGVRKWAVDNKDKFPCKIRFENVNSKTGKTITWVHFDTKDESKNPKVYLFNI